MNMKVTCALVFLAIIIISCGEKKMTEEEVKQIGMSPCRSTAPFIKELGFDPTRSGMSTNEANIRGIVLVEYPRKVADSASKRSYQDVNWNKNGWMGQTTTDAAGNIYTAPLPKENEPGIPLNQMNKVYKIDSETGKMDVHSSDQEILFHAASQDPTPGGGSGDAVGIEDHTDVRIRELDFRHVDGVAPHDQGFPF